MASYVRVPKHLLNLRGGFRRGVRLGARSVENTLRNAVKESILKRWHKTGESAGAVTSEIEALSGGNFRILAKSGTKYDVFGEYGTGTEGEKAAPSFKPDSWEYGKLKGMKPRMAFHIGLEEAMPDAIKDFETAIVSEMSK